MGAARALAVGSLADHGMPSWLPRRAQTSTENVTGTSPQFFAIPAGDLNADGTADAIGLLPSPGGMDGVATVAGVSGLDGSTLWTSTAPADLLWAFPGKFGPQAEEGVLFQTYRFIGDVTNKSLVRIELRLIAFGGWGATLWDRTFAGYHHQFSNVPVLHEYPFLDGMMNATPSGATDILIDQLSVVDLTARFESKDRAVVVNGADGSTVSEHEHGGTNRLPAPFPVSDYSGDGLDDYFFLDFLDGGASMVVGVTGQDLWESVTLDPEQWQSFVEVGDATGDGVADLAIWAAPDVALLNGANGSVVWQQPSMWPREIGDVDRDGLPDVGVLEFSTKVDAWAIRSAALSGRSGTELFSARHEIDLPGGEWQGGDSTAVLFPNLGDVDVDGATDTGHTLNVTLYDKDDNVTYLSENAGVASGRGGHRLWEGDISQLYALAATLDGSGTDLLGAVFSEDLSSIDLEGINGRTGKALWARTLDLGAPSAIQISIQDFDGDGRSDLLIASGKFGEGGAVVFESYLLDGSTGASRW